METLILILIIAYSVILHEIAHGLVAYKLGDPTAKFAGRLTLNPISHIDPIGTILLPLFTYFSGGFIFGWAKPVPYDPTKLNNPSRDAKLIALAGPLTNLLLAIILSIIFKSQILPQFLSIFYIAIRLNVVLAIFNLLPIPPLDGSKLILSSLPIQMQIFLETTGFILIFIFLFLFWPFLKIIVDLVFNLLI